MTSYVHGENFTCLLNVACCLDKSLKARIDILATFTQFKTHRWWVRWDRGAHILVPKNTFMDVFDISCDMGDIRAHIFCPQMTQELPKKHYDRGLNNCLEMHCHK